MSTGLAIPGTNVPTGAGVTPGGAQGLTGPSQVSADAGNLLTIGSDSLISLPATTIWSTRLRSFNAVGNPGFEADQRNVGNQITNPASGAFVIDRWSILKSGTATLAANWQQTGPPNPGTVPGTNFRISSKQLVCTLTTQQASLAAGDYYGIIQTVEGCQLRELIADVHSVSLLVYTSVAGLKFSVAIRDTPATQSLVSLCTVPNANTWTLITLPNLPIFPSGGNFSMAQGAAGYTIGVFLAAGSSLIAPATGVWSAASYVGASGMTNFAAQAVNSTFYLGFVQHEPSLCTTLQDKPFLQNYNECLRYYQKSWPYPIAVGTTNANSYATFFSIMAVSGTTFSMYGGPRFSTPLARVPTSATAYHPNTGAASQALLYYAASGTIPNASAAQGVTSVVTTAGGISAMNMASGTSTAPMVAMAEWVADTGW